jgi:hypothetical protein
MVSKGYPLSPFGMSFRPNLHFMGMGYCLHCIFISGVFGQYELGGLNPSSISVLSPDMRENLALNLHVHPI